jgi:hypothetical protein
MNKWRISDWAQPLADDIAWTAALSERELPSALRSNAPVTALNSNHPAARASGAVGSCLSWFSIAARSTNWPGVPDRHRQQHGRLWLTDCR